MRSLVIACNFGEVKIIDEPTYTFGSADNTRRYKHEIKLTPGERPTSVYGVLINDDPIIVFGAGGGRTAVHEHSALILNSKLYLAVGDNIVCFLMGNHHLAWSLKADPVTCFGIHYNSVRHALLSHGELEIVRIDEAGEVLWASPGADIFSGGFWLEEEYIAVVDFEHREYHFSYETGVPI
jgi:hypothetical protein